MALIALGWYGYNTLNGGYFPKGSKVGNTTTYTAAEIERFYTLPWHHGEFMLLNAPNVVVVGDLNDSAIKAAGNVTIEGNMTNSSVVAKDGVIHAQNLKHSALTADDVFVSGTAVDSRVWIDGYIFHNGKKTSQRTHPFPSGYRYLNK